MKKLFVVVFILLTAVCLLVSPVAAFKITLVGEVNDNEQFLSEEDLVLNYIAQKVKVVGILKETRDSKIIKVESFEVVE
jgi:hypothetical protein